MTAKKSTKLLKAPLLASLVLLTGVACSSSSNQSKAAQSDYTVASLCHESDPIVEPECYQVTQAVFDEVNAKGGVNGHQLKLQHCDNKNDPTTVTACIRKYTTDDTILAFVGDSYDPGICSQLTSQKMASIAPLVLNADDLTCSNAFPISGWGGAAFAASAKYTIGKGARAPAAIYPANQAGEQSVGGLQSVYGPENVPVEKIPASYSSPSYSPFVAKAASVKADPLYVLESAPIMLKIFQAAEAQSYSPTFVLPYTCAHTDFLTQIGDRGNGSVCAVPYKHAGAKSAAPAAFVSTMDKYGPNDWRYTYNGVNSWIASHILIQALTSIQGDASRSSLLDAMKKLTYSDEFTLDPINFSKLPGTLKGQPRVPTASFEIYSVQNGGLQPVTEVSLSSP